MTGRFDDELHRAFAEHGEKSLEGWQFTPAMQQRVLQRVRTEEESVAAGRPSRRLTLPRQLVWVAVAAAAFAIAIRIGEFDGFGGARKSPAATSAPQYSAEKAAAPAPSAAPVQTTAAPTAPTPRSVAADTSGGQPSLKTMAPTAPSVAAEPAVAGSAARDRGAFELTPPAIAAAEASPATTSAPRFMMKAAVVQLDLAAAQAVSEARVLSQTGVRAVDAQGAQRWEQPLPDLSEQSRLAVSADGHSAVSAGQQVYILSPAGELERTLNLTGNAARVVWSEDGRLAVVLETGVAVYRADRLQYAVGGVAGAEVRFAPDGALAVLGSAGPVRNLALYDYYGTQLMQVEPAGAAHALSFSPDGSLLMAGARAYDRQGRVLWQAVLEPDGVSPLAGTPLLLLWNDRTAQVVTAGDGTEVWRAQWNGKDGLRMAEVAATGGYVAITAPTENGGALWVMDGAGRQVLSEGLPAVPSHLAFAGNRLLFLLDQGLQTRELKP